MSTNTTTTTTATVTSDSVSSVGTPSQLAARARLVEVKSDLALMHAEMAKLKEELQAMTHTYMAEMQEVLMTTLGEAMKQAQIQTEESEPPTQTTPPSTKH